MVQERWFYTMRMNTSNMRGSARKDSHLRPISGHASYTYARNRDRSRFRPRERLTSQEQTSIACKREPLKRSKHFHFGI